MKNISQFAKKAALVRKWSLVSTTEAGSGHPTTCLSAADLATVLFDKYFTFDIKNPKNPTNDRIIFSKGHAAPLMYTLFALSGAFAPEELLNLRKFGNSLEGHPTMEFPYTEAATGSLGQGLSVGAGIAFALRAQNQKSKIKNQKLPKVYVLMGDGEMAEGSVWEAANFSSHYKLDNLIGIVDVNRLGQSQETMFGHQIEKYNDRLSAFGWKTIVINGHNFIEIVRAFKLAVSNKSGKPFVIIAKTKKGKGISFLEDKDGWHGKALKKEELEKALKELGEIDESLRFKLRLPVQKAQNTQQSRKSDSSDIQKVRHADLSEFSESSEKYQLGDKVATREVYGKVLAQLANTNSLIYSLDADTKNSTFSQDFKAIHSDRFIECFIAEQNMTGVALGLSTRGKIPFVATFAAFLTRAFDQIRMSAISKANIKFVGSHAGVSIGEDGSSQMGLEDMAMFGSLPDSVIFHPADAVSAAKILPLLASHYGISYLRTLRPKTSVLYDKDEDFTIGGAKIIRESDNDLLTIVAAGITVHEAVRAHDKLKAEGILVRVVDCYCVKPIDQNLLVACINETKKNIIVTVEDHFEHGGLGDFVLSALSSVGARVEKMAVRKFARSGTKDELLDYVGISAKHIVKKVKSLL